MFLNSTPHGSGLRLMKTRCGHLARLRLPTAPRQAHMVSSTPSSQPGSIASFMRALNASRIGRTKHHSSASKDSSSSGPKLRTCRIFWKRLSGMPQRPMAGGSREESTIASRLHILSSARPLWTDREIM